MLISSSSMRNKGTISASNQYKDDNYRYMPIVHPYFEKVIIFLFMYMHAWYQQQQHVCFKYIERLIFSTTYQIFLRKQHRHTAVKEQMTWRGFPERTKDLQRRKLYGAQICWTAQQQMDLGNKTCLHANYFGIYEHMYVYKWSYINRLIYI